ncbi:putative oxidoreductase [Zhongshania aliphaticivorans]|uniref:Putative oxidoreductase n=1 Tax=Zhongshania aliphaticivorans TaxID=1470434 RepID=A0A5S9NP52_9GAMM|nr:SDR family NAD(P)-dependent oxidoreductase [Zhongshania aliphaticivorans]CAA0092144.1 putative oxidoreductase [Zhongshania aliphaticivorans]CAA0109280.1 putative oxidoreductase [Zhongshania aliphaticivorans]
MRLVEPEITMEVISDAKPVAIVSGGSSGIGLAFVSALCKQGYQVVTCGRDKAKLDAVEKQFPSVDTYVCDVASRDDVIKWLEAIRPVYPNVVLLVSNAGGLTRVNLQDDFLRSDINGDIYSNLCGAINFISAFLPAVTQTSGGKIIVVGSGFGIAPASYAPIYSAAKAGLHSFCKGLRLQLQGTSVSVTEVLPPVVDTPATAHRNDKKLSANTLVTATLKAAKQGRSELYLGKSRLLPYMMRIAPAITEKIAANS